MKKVDVVDGIRQVVLCPRGLRVVPLHIKEEARSRDARRCWKRLGDGGRDVEHTSAGRFDFNSQPSTERQNRKVVFVYKLKRSGARGTPPLSWQGRGGGGANTEPSVGSIYVAGA